MQGVSLQFATAVALAMAIAASWAHAQNVIIKPAEALSAEAHVSRVPDGTIHLDGALDEPAWSAAPVMVLTQQDPHPGQPTAYRTEVRLLADKEHLYLGVTCVDPDPEHLSIHTITRDSDQTDDDHLTVVLDPFGTQRLGYVFQVNAGGGRAKLHLHAPIEGSQQFSRCSLGEASERKSARNRPT